MKYIILFYFMIGACFPLLAHSDQNEIYSIRSEYACDINRKSEIYNYVDSFLRESNEYEFNVSDNLAYRSSLSRALKVADRFIAPSFIKKYHITSGTSTITDAYGDLRPPEIICIKNSAEGSFEIYIFTYSKKATGYAVIDRLIVVTESGEKYIYPVGPPEKPTQEATKVYGYIGAEIVPSSSIKVLEKIFKQRL